MPLCFQLCPVHPYICVNTRIVYVQIDGDDQLFPLPLWFIFSYLVFWYITQSLLAENLFLVFTSPLWMVLCTPMS